MATRIKPVQVQLSSLDTKRSVGSVIGAVFSMAFTAIEALNSLASGVKAGATSFERTAIAADHANESWAGTWLAEQEAEQRALMLELNATDK